MTPHQDHMLAICSETEQVVFKTPKPSSNAEKVSHGTKPEAKKLDIKIITSSKQPSISSKEATKCGSSKAPTSKQLLANHIRVTGEARANPQLNSGMSAFNLNEPIFSASFIIHSESALRNDASAVSTAKVDPGKSAPSNQALHVSADKTQSVSEGLETVLA
ncbi:hypothetical protein Tco_1530466 [Tanacetum coccineum]